MIDQSFEITGINTITVTLTDESLADEQSFVERNMFGLGALAIVIVLVGVGWWYYSNNRENIPPISQE
jgi:hypothetical protein